MANPIVKIEMMNGDVMEAELYPEIAPNTVNNFISLVKKGFYDGLIFHRVIDKFMIQAGGYYIDNNTLFDKEAPNTIKGEFSANGVENNLKHKLGILSMARSNDPNSASSQFFICSASSPHLDGNYAAFGKVLDDESLATVLDISHVETANIGYGFANFPIDPIVIRTILVY